MEKENTTRNNTKQMPLKSNDDKTNYKKEANKNKDLFKVFNINNNKRVDILEVNNNPEKEYNYEEVTLKEEDFKNNNKTTRQIKEKTIVDFSSFFKKKPVSKYNVNDYFMFENDNILISYGPEIFNFMKNQERTSVFKDLITRHSLTPEIRIRMVDWIIEIYNVFEFSDQTFFTTVHIFDTYLAKTKKILEDKDVHLLGMISMFLGSKFEESYPIKLDFLYEKIGHKLFTKDELVLKEREVLKEISADTIIGTSMLECISSFFYDFYQNNKEFLNNFNMGYFIKHLELNAIYYAKLLTHFHMFSEFPSCFKALSCVLVSFDEIRVDVQKLSADEEYYMKEWVRYIMKENKYEFKYENMYNNIIESVKTYNKLDLSFNLNISYKRRLERFKKIYEKLSEEKRNLYNVV